jgi:hypothetical protein
MMKCIVPTSSDIRVSITHTKSNISQRRNNDTGIWEDKIMKKYMNGSSEMGTACV